MTIVMGLDQHRAQITAEWVDTETGEIGRMRVAPAQVGARVHLAGADKRAAGPQEAPQD